MQIFNLAEELEKERKKNKELEEKIKELKKYEKQYIIEAGTNHILTERIDKAIEYINNNYPVCSGKELLDILKGE